MGSPASRRLIGTALVVVSVVALLAAARLSPTVPQAVGSDAANVLSPSPFSLVLTPLLLACGAILLVGGIAGVAGSEPSARVAFGAPALGAAGAVAFGAGLADPAVLTSGVVGVEPVRAAIDGTTGAIAAGAVVGGSVAPVVRAATTEDTVALLLAVGVALAATATAPGSAMTLLTGGVGGVGAVATLVAVDDAWRP